MCAGCRRHTCSRHTCAALYTRTFQAMSEPTSRGIKANSTCSRCDQDLKLIRCVMTPANVSNYLFVSRSCRSLERCFGITKCFRSCVQLSGNKAKPTPPLHTKTRVRPFLLADDEQFERGTPLTHLIDGGARFPGFAALGINMPEDGCLVKRCDGWQLLKILP